MKDVTAGTNEIIFMNLFYEPYTITTQTVDVFHIQTNPFNHKLSATFWLSLKNSTTVEGTTLAFIARQEIVKKIY